VRTDLPAYVYRCAFVCAYVCVLICRHMCIGVRLCVYTCAYWYAGICVCVCVCVCIRVRTDMPAYLYVCAFVCAYVCVRERKKAFMHVYVVPRHYAREVPYTCAYTYTYITYTCAYTYTYIICDSLTQEKYLLVLICRQISILNSSHEYKYQQNFSISHGKIWLVHEILGCKHGKNLILFYWRSGLQIRQTFF